MDEGMYKTMYPPSFTPKVLWITRKYIKLVAPSGPLSLVMVQLLMG